MILRTMIGSLPVLADNMILSIKKAISLQIKYDLDLISDGEPRFDMIEYFKQIPGFAKGEGRMYIDDRIKPEKDISKNYKIQDFKIVRKVLKSINKESNVIKTSITGPITLGLTCAANKVKYYRGVLDDQLYYDLSDALIPLIKELLMSNSWVQIDEPGISAGYMSPKRSQKILNYLLSGFKEEKELWNKISLHLCGNLTRIPNFMETVLNIDCNTLSLAFSGKTELENIKVISRKNLTISKKKLGVGCVRADAEKVEDVDTIKCINERVRCIRDKVGFKNILMIHPDCGLKTNSLDVVKQILYNMRAATQEFMIS